MTTRPLLVALVAAEKLPTFPNEVTWIDFPVNVFDLVMMGVRIAISRWHSVGKAEEAIVQNALEKMDIAHLANRSLNELSGESVNVLW